MSVCVCECVCVCVAVPCFPVIDIVVTPLARTQAAASTVSSVDPL